ncbi:MAG: 50S ribosome-binding GTPase [Clostridium sp.]|nr:50S ribosome-binding GTPase [Clostridium sp.]
MNKLSEGQLEVIAKLCSDDYAKRLRALQEKQKDNTVKIVNTGMVSSGKSSLYNTLINSSDEFFPTGAARTTIKANYYDYKNISYVDTPGIDVRNEDDALAFDTIIESDIILMIHNIRTGPLNKSEVEWLEQIVSRLGSKEMCKARIIFVASWKDTREKEDDYLSFMSELKNQVFEVIGVEIPFFEVSVKKYQQGIEKSKQVLIDSSGVLMLKEYLEYYATEYLKKKQSIDEEEYVSLLKEISNELQDIYQEKDRQKEEIIENVKNKQKSRKNAWKQVYDYFSAQRTKLTNLQNELRNI